LLVDFVVRNHSPQGFSIPADLAHGYVSAIRRLKLSHTVREPLAVLCHVGILRRVRRATNGWHLKLPAAYALAGEYVKRRFKLDVALVRTLNFSVNSRAKIVELLRDPHFAPSTSRALEAVDRAVCQPTRTDKNVGLRTPQ
jgi:hypothetical protein